MKHESNLIVGIAEGKVAWGDGELVSYALGSCVGICLYDGTRHIAGLAHILLPSRALATEKTNPYKFADSGTEALVLAMERMGAVRAALTAKIAGGAKMFQVPEGQQSVGDKNVLAVRQALRALHIPLRAQDVGAEHGRSIYFSVRTGMLRVKSIRAGERML